MLKKKNRDVILISILILNLIFFGGLLIRSVIFFLNEINFDFARAADAELQTWFLWRKRAEFIFSASYDIYIMGHIIVCYNAARKNAYISLKSIALYYLIQIALMFLCTVPFEILDSKYFGDYLFPIWGTGVTLLLILFIMSAYEFVKKWRKLCRGD